MMWRDQEICSKVVRGKTQGHMIETNDKNLGESLEECYRSKCYFICIGGGRNSEWREGSGGRRCVSESIEIGRRESVNE
jgi:hypothetical protein